MNEEMDLELKERLKKIILEFEGIRCVYITKNDAFFIFKRAFKDHQVVEENWSDDGSGRPVFDGWVGNVSSLDDCAIFHKDKLIEGRDIRDYVANYRTKIEESPELLVDTILDEEAKKETKKEGCLKINSPRYITPIKDLFIGVGLLPEKRGRNKNKNQKWRKLRDKAIIAAFNKITKTRNINKNLPLKAIREEVKKRMPKEERFRNADELRDVEKIFDVSDAVIRRALKPYFKK